LLLQLILHESVRPGSPDSIAAQQEKYVMDLRRKLKGYGHTGRLWDFHGREAPEADLRVAQDFDVFAPRIQS